MFTTSRGTPIDQRETGRRWHRTLRRLSIPDTRLHTTRHTYASMLIADGASLDDVKRALGHSSIAITSDIYGHLVAERSAQLAASMDRMVRRA